MAMDGHDHHPGLGVGLRPSTPEPSTRFLEAAERAALDLGLPSAARNFFFQRETGHAPSLVPNQETKTRTFIYTQI